MTISSEQTMLKAVQSRDNTYDGSFYYGVITTGVFCQPSCSSRLAKVDNLRFFMSVESALVAGFRPCKRCKPTQSQPAMDRLVELARYIESHADERLTLKKLADRTGLSTSRLQRIFKAAFGLSPKMYQDAIRMRQFKKSLQQGEAVTDAIFSSGYGSISRIYGESMRNIGMTPKAYRAGGAGEMIVYVTRETSLGLMAMAATEKGVCFVQFGESNGALLEQLQKEFPKADIRPSPSHSSTELELWMEALEHHLNREAPCPELPLDLLEFHWLQLQ